MRIHQTLTALAIIGALAARAGTTASNAVLTTTAEIRSLTNDRPRATIPFHLVGTVTYLQSKDHFILQDETGAVGINNHCIRKDTYSPTLGERISVQGGINLSPKQSSFCYASAITPLGTGSVPEPRELSIGDLKADTFSETLARTSGHVIDAFQDEIDSRYKFLTLSDGTNDITVSVYCTSSNSCDLGEIRDAEISVTGFLARGMGGSRMLHQHNIATKPADIRILKSAPADPFAVETIDLSRSSTIQGTLNRLSRRRVDGTVTAVWNGNRFLIDTDNYRTLQVHLAPEVKPPKVGERVSVVGMPGTDLFTVNLTGAIWRPTSGTPRPPDKPIRIVREKRFTGKTPRHILFNPRLHGCPVQIRGTVRNVSLSDFNTPRLHVEYGQNVIPVDASSCPEALSSIENGYKVEVTGVCLMETESWQPRNRFPHVKGFFMILRSAEDIRVLSRPPWWTPGRLLAVIGILLASLLGFVVWNRILNRLVERRSRELLKEQVAHTVSELRISERTRLAVELHDSLSQNLAGVACQVAASRNLVGADDALARSRLLTAEQMLKSCRTELRHCLFDLRSDMLGEPDFAVAVRKTLDQLDTEAEIAVDVDIPRARLLDSTAHALLCIVRELVSNAIRHGHAGLVKVAGRFQGRTLSVSVRDDGVTLIDGKPFFPIGIYAVSRREFNGMDFDKAFRDLKKAGFNFAHTYGDSYDPEFLAAARKHDVKLWVQSRTPGAKFVEIGRHHPSIIAWYLGDDTSMHETPEELKNYDDMAKAVDPTRITCQADVVGHGVLQLPYERYLDGTDVIMPEIYPISGKAGDPSDRTCVARTIENMRSFVNAAKGCSEPRACWPILQYFQGWSSWLHFPSREQLFATSFAAIIHGAKGITWYTYGGYYNKRRDYYDEGITSRPERFRDMADLCTWLQELAPALVERDCPQPTVTVVGGTKTDPVGNPAVSALLKRHGAVAYLITVNSAPSATRARFKLGKFTGSAEVMREGRRVELADGTFEDDYVPLGFHVYRFGN